ncbi:extracellular solute-binding protein [Bradyrhizobium sp. dw_78]|uniref:extracellular solute-binding protein n=1 Tax=Bradyrhizobium sp. dw_78 TaxID=2719793 RepID=UPI001BD2F948|nr:extracellular solute-binding protein [Bradyrhizobium sp. dw_78]
MLTRRHVLGGFGAGLATAAWPGGMLVRADENSVTITSLGGKWEQSIREDFIPLFKQRTGAEVKVVLGAPTQWTAQIEALPGKPPLDAVDNSETLAIALIDKGLVSKLSVDKVPNLADIPLGFRQPFDDFGASYQYSTSGIFFNADKIKSAPKSWAEFFERAGKGEFGRSITLPDIGYAWGPFFIWHYAVAMGGSMDNLDPAFDALRKIKPYMVKFWGTALEVERMIMSKEVDIGVLWDGRVTAMMSGGAKFLDFKRLAPHSLVTLSPAQVVKGGNERLAYEWVNTLLDPEPQLKYFKRINFAPTNSKVQIPDELKANIMPLSEGITPDYRELIRATPKMVERWNSEIRG